MSDDNENNEELEEVNDGENEETPVETTETYENEDEGRVEEADENDTEGQGSPVPDNQDSTIYDTQQEPNTRFLTNILYENNGTVYGLEVLLFDINDRQIEKILVVDETSFDSWTELTKQIQDVCVPYTENDALLLDDIQSERAKIGKIQSDNHVYTYQDYVDYLQSLIDDGKWSSLKKLGSLENVLKNEPTEVTDGSGGTIKTYPVNINATTLMDMSSDMFSKVGHEHNYAERIHSSPDGSRYGVGRNDVFGHVKIINNLTTEQYNDGEALSAYQGKVLKDEVEQVSTDFKNSWSTVYTPNSYVKYKVNESLRLVVCNYNRKDYTGLKSSTQSKELHKAGTIPQAYAPSSRVNTPLYRGDVVLYFNKDGSIRIRNLTKIKSINLYAQVMWHY